MNIGEQPKTKEIFDRFHDKIEQILESSFTMSYNTLDDETRIFYNSKQLSIVALNIDTTKMGTPIHVRIASPYAMLFNVFSSCTEPVNKTWSCFKLNFSIEHVSS